MPQCSTLLKLAAESNEHMSTYLETKEDNENHQQRELALSFHNHVHCHLFFLMRYIEQPLRRNIFPCACGILEECDLANAIQIFCCKHSELGNL